MNIAKRRMKTGMNDKDVFESNRTAWNEAMGYHQAKRKDDLHIGFKDPKFTTFTRDCDAVLLERLNDIGIAGKTISQMPCNNGRELLSIMRMGAESAVGFDISDAAVEEARLLAEAAMLDAEFVRTDILEIDDRYNGTFDLIYISEGSLQWFPDLHAYFSVVSRLLKENGEILIFEMHPFAYLFENGFEFEEHNFNDMTSYFEKGPYHYPDGLDYVGGTSYKAKECFWFMHKMSDVINAVLKSGMEITEFDEYNLEMANTLEGEMYDKLPLSYILIGRKGTSDPNKK